MEQEGSGRQRGKLCAESLSIPMGANSLKLLVKIEWLF